MQAGDLLVPLKALASLGEQSKHLMQPTTTGGGGGAASVFLQAVAPKLTAKSAAKRTAACWGTCRVPMLDPACSWLLLLRQKVCIFDEEEKAVSLDGEMVLGCMRLYRGQGAGRQVVTV